MSRRKRPPVIQEYTRESLQRLAWMIRRQAAQGRPVKYLIRWAVKQLEAAGGGKYSESRWIEHDVIEKLDNGYCVFYVDTMVPGDYSAIRHGDNGQPPWKTKKSIEYVRAKYPDALIANDDPQGFVRAVQEMGINEDLFTSGDPHTIIEKLHLKETNGQSKTSTHSG